MAYSESVLTRARARLEARRLEAETKREALRRQVYETLPEIRAMDRALQAAVPKVLAAAFRQGEDPKEAVEALRRENLALQERRAALLTSKGYDPAALEESPLCPHCGDRGYQGASMCDCLQKLCTEEQFKELSHLLNLGDMSFDKFRLEYYGTEPSPLHGRSPRQNMEKVLAFCKAFGKNFGKGPVKNLLLYGGTGLGKTFLSACMAREVSQGGHSVVYDTAGNIFARFEEQKFSRDQDDVREARDLTRKYLRCDLLIFDDLGSELATPFIQSALYQIVNTRLTEGLGTIISTNFTMEELERRYTPQIISRLRGEYEALPFFGEDIRLIKKG